MGFFNESSRRTTAIIALNAGSSELLDDVSSLVNRSNATLKRIEVLQPKTFSKFIAVIDEEIALLRDYMIRHSLLEKTASSQVKGSPSAMRMRAESIDRLGKVKDLIKDWVDVLTKAAHDQGIINIERELKRNIYTVAEKDLSSIPSTYVETDFKKAEPVRFRFLFIVPARKDFALIPLLLIAVFDSIQAYTGIYIGQVPGSSIGIIAFLIDIIFAPLFVGFLWTLVLFLIPRRIFYSLTRRNDLR